MAVSKIDFTFENLHFSCKGDNAWVERQLNMVLSRIPSLLAVHRKGENIVEDVIEVKEEDEKLEVSAEAPSDAKKTPKVPKEKKTKEVKVKIAKVPKVKVIKEKLAKVPKIKVAKITKIAKVPKDPKVKMSTEVDANISEKPAMLGRNPKTETKIGGAKKKIANIKSPVPSVDSQLSLFLTEKKVSTNQVRKFLATAVFLADSSGVSRLSTSMISTALKINGIEKLQNASDCLNKNEKKGYCIKDGKEFIISENGYLSIG
jgi:hypothetical protein